MPILNLDFSNVPSREPLEPGWYAARIEAVEEKLSSTNKPMIVLTYLITGDANGEPVEGNRKIFENLVLVENCLWKVKSVFSALGIPTEDICELDTDELVGMELAIKLVQETYQGEIRNYTKGCKSLDEMAE